MVFRVVQYADRARHYDEDAAASAALAFREVTGLPVAVRPVYLQGIYAPPDVAIESPAVTPIGVTPRSPTIAADIAAPGDARSRADRIVELRARQHRIHSGPKTLAERVLWCKLQDEIDALKDPLRHGDSTCH